MSDDLGPLPEHVAKGLPRLFVRWLMENRVQMNLKVDVISGAVSGNLPLLDSGGKLIDSGKAPPAGAIVGTTDAQSLTNKTLTLPVILNFSNAVHAHADADGGGQVSHGALTGRAADDHSHYLNETRHDTPDRHGAMVLGTAWENYGDDSTIIGWSSFDEKSIYLKRIGSLYFVAFRLAGTSNSTTVSFTLPVNMAAGPSNINPWIRTRDDSITDAAPGYIRLAPGDNLVSCSRSGGTGWTAANNKIAIGQFFFEGA